ncbi:MAG: lipocalin family protein [Ferruginibacter sp.]|nr:lipocalin family protein [Ferruginibacter sp.]
MRNVLLAVLLISVIASCKKSKKNTCEVSVAAMAGNYKLTKYSAKITSQPEQDLTSTLTSCEKSGVYHLNADKSAIYTNEASCADNETGTWDIVNGKISIDIGYGVTDLLVTGWDCNGFNADNSASVGPITTTYSLHFVKQ